MVDVTYQMVLSSVQTVAMLVGIAYYIMTLNYTRRNQEQTLKARKYTNYNDIMEYIKTPTGVKTILLLDSNPFSSYEEWRELVNKNQQFLEAWVTICCLCDVAGIILREGITSIDMYAHFQLFWWLGFWRQSKPVIYEMRKDRGPSYFRNMDYLMDSLEKYIEEHPALATSNR